MPGIKELKRRIKSIGSTRKITRAMQMVSAAKMRKAQSQVLNSRSYAALAWELISSVRSVIPENLSASENLSGIQNQELDAGSESGMTQLLNIYPSASKVGVLMLSSSRGMVGSLNMNLFAKLKEVEGAEVITEMITYGKFAKNMSVRTKKNVVADFPKMEKTISVEDIYPIAEYVAKAYQTGQYKKIVIIYNHFVSTLVQKPTAKQLLPFGPSSEDVAAATGPFDLTQGHPERSRMGGRQKMQADGLRYNSETTDYLFEPNPQQVLNHLLPRIIESQIYHTILESDASEHSARMVMMKNATEAAGDLVDDLTLTYNQLRQNKITTELAEITAGKIALE